MEACTNIFMNNLINKPSINPRVRQGKNPEFVLDLLQKKYVLSLKVCSSLGQTLNYWVDWHLLKLAQPARL